MPHAQPTLFTSQLELVPSKSSDLWEVWDIWSEPDVHPRVFGDGPSSLEAVLSTFESWTGNPGRHLGLWMIRTRHGRQVVGCVSLARRAFSRVTTTQLCGPVEFQIVIRGLYRGQGLGFDATRVALRHAFSSPELPFLMASSDAHDGATSSLLARLGFRSTCEHPTARGTRRGHLLTREDFSVALDAAQAA
jgi:RimJ/RimL family protein N-acetyltransferase